MDRDEMLDRAIAQIERNFPKFVGPLKAPIKYLCHVCWGNEDVDCRCKSRSCGCAYCWWFQGAETRRVRLLESRDKVPS